MGVAFVEHGDLTGQNCGTRGRHTLDIKQRARQIDAHLLELFLMPLASTMTCDITKDQVTQATVWAS
jgi:hypothetical protein